MGRRAVVGAVLLGLAAACSSGGGSSSPTTTTTSTTTSTTAPTTSTTTPEAAVKQAYLAYWTMVDRLFAAPDPSDPELLLRAADPLLSSVKDQLASKKSEGHVYKIDAERPNEHRIQTVILTAGGADVADCYIDGRTELDSNGAVVDNAIATKLAHATLVGSGTEWRVTQIQFVQETNGVSGCAA